MSMAFHEKATVVKVLTVQCHLGILVMVVQSQLISSVNFVVIMSNMHDHVHL